MDDSERTGLLERLASVQQNQVSAVRVIATLSVCRRFQSPESYQQVPIDTWAVRGAACSKDACASTPDRLRTEHTDRQLMETILTHRE